MLGNDRMETASTEVTSIWRRNDIEKSTWRTHRYFVDFESWIQVETATSNRCHNFHVDSPFKIDVISTNFPRGISTSNWWRIDEEVFIGSLREGYIDLIKNAFKVFLFLVYSEALDSTFHSNWCSGKYFKCLVGSNCLFGSSCLAHLKRTFLTDSPT